MNKILCLYTDGGGGHKATSLAIKKVIEAEYQNASVNVINVYKMIVLELDIAYRFIRRTAEDIYNYLFLNKNLTFLWPLMTHLAKLNVKIQFKKASQLFADYLIKHKPDLVISCMGFMNSIYEQGIKQSGLNIKLIIVMTDFDELCKGYWISSKSVYYLCGTDMGCKRIQTYGVPNDHIIKLSGMIVDSKFYGQAMDLLQRTKLRLRHGLSTNKLTAIISYGAYGSKYIEKILYAIHKAKLDIQLIIVCGKNQLLQSRLSSLPYKQIKLILGYVEDIDYYIKLSDLFIGKPGPGSVSESLVCGIPVLIEKNHTTLPQEIPVAKWIRQNKLGWCVKKLSNHKILKKIFTQITQEIPIYKKNISSNTNYAIFEMAEIIRFFLPKLRKNKTEELEYAQSKDRM